jgi:hypothetical protein
MAEKGTRTINASSPEEKKPLQTKLTSHIRIVMLVMIVLMVLLLLWMHAGQMGRLLLLLLSHMMRMFATGW